MGGKLCSVRDRSRRERHLLHPYAAARRPRDNAAGRLERAALALVATGATPYGIVYLTDATADARVSVVFNIPEDLHPPIVYPAAAVSDNDLSFGFLDHLQSIPAQSLFRSQGFVPMGAP